MENEKKTVNESENKDVGIAITDSEIKRRLERFKMLIGNLRGEPRLEILPFRCVMQETSFENKGQGILLSATTGARRVEQSNCLDTMYHKGLGSKQERPAVIKCVQRTKDQHGRVYDTEGISPTLTGASKLSGDCTPKIKAVLTPDRATKRQNGRRFKEPGEPSFTVTGQDIHGIAITHPTITEAIGRQGSSSEFKSSCEKVYKSSMQIRRLTPTECERLQGFPDNWTEFGIDDKGLKVKMSDTQRYKQMGNAVTTNVIRAIGDRLWQKSSQQRKMKNIRRKTRKDYPLLGKRCQIIGCSKKAEEHHHNTIPIKYNKFIYVCHNHHVKIHQK